MSFFDLEVLKKTHKVQRNNAPSKIKKLNVFEKQTKIVTHMDL
jgi:hypothetical protein